MIDLGDTVTLAAECRDAAGALANATTVALTVTLPDGTTATPPPTNPPGTTGRYTHPYVTTQSGRHTARWVLTGGVPTQAWTDVFDVAPANPIALVGLERIKNRLKIPLATTVHDEDLRALIASVTDVIEDIVGVVVRRSFTETYSGQGGSAILLRRRPVVSVTSVTVNGTLVNDYSVNPAGVLTRAGRWPAGADNITATYVAGRVAPSASVLDGAEDLIRINWRPQVGGNHSVFDGGRSDDSAAGQGEIRLGFFVPNTVMQRLQPSARGPHIA